MKQAISVIITNTRAPIISINMKTPSLIKGSHRTKYTIISQIPKHMKNYIQILILLIIFFSYPLNINARKYSILSNIDNNSNTDSLTFSDNQDSNIEYPLFSFEYMLSSFQTPISKNYNLSGMNSNFSALRTDFNYGWYLDKQQEKSALLTTLGYTFVKTHIDTSNLIDNIPGYIINMPNIHHFHVGLIYNQKLSNNWEVSGYNSVTLSTDFSHKITNTDYSVNLLLYIQKQIKKISIGAGYVSYLIGNKVKGLPIGYLTYENKKIGIELMTPISLTCKYKFRNTNMLLLTSKLDFTGYSINEPKTNLPTHADYVDITNLDFNFCYDRKFLNNLHWNIGIGYYYREMIFLEKNKKIDKLIFDETIFLTGKIYCTF